MVTRLRVAAALAAVLAAVVVICQSAPTEYSARPVELRSTFAPLAPASTTIKWPVIDFTDPKPFVPCDEIPIDVVEKLGLAFTPPEPEDQLRCHYDAGNYQMAIEPIVWRSYEESIPRDALELEIAGHRAAQFWVMKPTDWNDRWWTSCMVMFKTKYGVIQQSLFYSPIYSNPEVDCLAENLKRAHQLAPHYKF